MKTIEIKGVRYTEAKADEALAAATGEVCSQCAFGAAGFLGHCGYAIDNSTDVFGGDCAERDVIYRRVA